MATFPRAPTDGYCCKSACNGLCQACRGDWTGAANGTCAPISGGTDPDTECGAATCTGDGNCSAPAPNGSPCGRNDQCGSNNCVDNVCCDSPCASRCEACSAKKTGLQDGTCAPIPPFQDPDGECLAGDAAGCSGAGECKAAVKLTASDAQEHDLFGQSVAISGDYAIIGAVWEDGGTGDPLEHAGAAYVIRRTGGTWDAGTKLMAPDAQAFDGFGSSVAISGDAAIVGAPFEYGGSGDPVYESGAAYVFLRAGDTWSAGTRLVRSDAEMGDRLGSSVAVDGDYAIVGAPYSRSDGGTSYVFRRTGNTWNAGPVLVSPDELPQEFGWSVAISGSDAIVGDLYDGRGIGLPLPGAGSAYVY